MSARAWSLLLALSLAQPIAAQTTPDTVVVYVLGRVREARVTCPSIRALGEGRAAGVVGDTLNCRIWAVDSSGAPTLASFTATSSAPGVVAPLGIVNDTILRLHLRAGGSATIVVSASPPVIGLGVLYYEGTPNEWLAPWGLLGLTVGLPANVRLCGYVVAAGDTLGKSWASCPGRAPVVPFTWSWEETPRG